MDQENNPSVIRNQALKERINLFFLILLALFLLTGTLLAQEEGEEVKIVRPFQVSLIPPLSTNGFMAGQVTNLFSLNIIAGYAGGLNGLELSGFGAMEKGEVYGVQLSGFGNIVGRSVYGVQLSGFANVAGRDVTGFQAGGFMNITGGNTGAVQLAGFMNTGGGSLRGFQAAGFMNIQGSASRSLQMAGFLNLNGGPFQGLQAAGFGNVASEMKGLQASGFFNVSGEVEGAQLAGFINIAGRVDGVQIGVINICDSISGAAIGVFSFVRQGYRAMEIWTSELFFVNAGFKSGTRQLYSILSAGFRPFPEPAWSYGFGMGTHRDIGARMSLDAELSSVYIVDDLWWSRNFNLLNQLKLNAGFRLDGNTFFFAGPSYSLLISDRTPPEPVSDLVPYAIFDGVSGRKRIRSWIGIQAGIRF